MNLSSYKTKKYPLVAALQGPAGLYSSEVIMAEAKPKRKAMSKKLRFDVFKRDSFTCQYCGSHPPKVVLHVDHIDPVANGGSNNIDNLVTACNCCNLGKGARLLSDIPQSLKDKAIEIAEREDQIKGYNDVLMQRINRINEEAWDIAAVIDGEESVDEYNKQSLESIRRFLEKLPFAEVLLAAKSAHAKVTYGGTRRFKYFCGICWGKVREAA